ncbi:MAG: MauE/DoxX family redox-associated membrane protein, partial [Candidatus Zixiibacteriota bacterium]
LVVGLIFIYAALDKIANPGQFARIVYNYHILPGSLINIMALTLPWVETISGIALILGLNKRGAIYIINLMVIVFIIAIGINFIRGVNLECGCFTVSSKAKGQTLSLLIRDFGLLILSGYLFFSRAVRFDLIKSKS